MGSRAQENSLSDLSLGPGEALRVEDVMRLLHLSKNTVYKLAREGSIPSYRVGRQIRFRSDDVLARAREAAGNAIPPLALAGGEGQVAPDVVPTALPDVLDEIPGWMRGSLVLGGQDLACDVLANYVAGLGVKVLRSQANGYVSLARMYLGTVHAAAISLWSEGEERYNIPYVREMLPGLSVVVFRLCRRRIGFTVPRQGRGSSAAPRPDRWGDLLEPGVRIANRERGAAARVLLDEKMAYLEARTSDIAGYDRVVTSEFAQALLVARGMANVAVTSEKPFRQMEGLDFLPMQDEVVDLAVVRTPETAELLRAAKNLLRTDAFRSEFDPTMYDTTSMGDVVYEA
ncbi:MAG: helix-turn-helix transcriptional regulator [Coriobacteriia bacterium]|nr:helix-turn-helix transcriptional regulator [Coriobacteriia bacterium]MBS5477039.1 helix-turn-helix transcriptional regulator [Coriobacteriia bacterium]